MSKEVEIRSIAALIAKEVRDKVAGDVLIVVRAIVEHPDIAVTLPPAVPWGGNSPIPPMQAPAQPTPSVVYSNIDSALNAAELMIRRHEDEIAALLKGVPMLPPHKLEALIAGVEALQNPKEKPA